MSNTSSQSPSTSIDLVPSPAENFNSPAEDIAPKQTRVHPLRLQHSPSLPNIWFPPHSGPIPRQMTKADSSITQRPSAPPSPKLSTSIVNTEKETRILHVKYASIDPIYRNLSASKTHARRRTERDQPHSLLTPPLTPSSSIQTSASLQSSNTSVPSSESGDAIVAEEIVDSESESTRILLLGNVNRQISMDTLKAAIVDALLASASTTDVSITPVLSLVRHDPLKGVNERYLVSKGVIPIIFFDVRVAKFAKEILVKKSLLRLRECVGDDVDDNGERRWLSARLVDLEELSKTLGYSPFLDGVDGTFFISVQSIKGAVEEDSANSDSFVRGGINVTFLQNILKSFGTIRTFFLSRQEVDENGKTSLVYNVEYHDSREAATAFNDLGNQVMFGMKITVFRKAPSFIQPAGTVPFPNPSTAGESFGGLTIGPPGSQSQTRQRFDYHVKDEAEESDGRETSSLSQVLTNPGSAPSPPVFYTSPFVDVATHPPPEQHPAGASLAGTSQRGAVPHRTEQQWDSDVIYRSDTVSPCYTPDGICLYCPSRGSVNTPGYNASFGQYGISPPTPTPLYYPPLVNRMPNLINVTPIPTYGAFPYEYMDPQLHPVPNAGPWGFDPAIAAVSGPNTLMPHPMNAPSPAPYFRREDLGPGRLYPAGYTHTSDQVLHHQPHAAGPSPRLNASPPTFARISTPESSPSSYRSASLVRYEQSNSAVVANTTPSGQSERNQLNLVRIEEGVDTRTTVMIKNIPNKMSDTDLTNYIGKVCPRRIDFLYLRMDFKNGCNVGYAFVNFIDVQDLLHFAKERLGAKWNMFSSEKVLQMSYANYQGKEALIEKFKNSAIMDERESWRPRIFYSSGPDQGLVEAFPAPTHIRRKERSSYNRGTLFPPGTNSHSHSHGLLNNTTARHYNEERLQQDRPAYIDRPASHLRNDRIVNEDESRHGHRVPGYRPLYKNSTYRVTR